MKFQEATSEVALSNCEKEPINIPGLIQPHGVLMAIDPSGYIEQVSANAPEVFGETAENLITKSLFDLISLPEREQLRETFKTLSTLPSINTLHLNGKKWNAFFHRHDGKILAEFESPTKQHEKNLQERLRQLTTALQDTHSLDELCQVAAEHTRIVTGYDRAMIYRFDEDWHGEVVAESTASGIHSYLGHHFPASDIPKQARDIFLTNWVRMIPDTHYTPVPLVPEINPANGRPLDLGQSFLRSVSPIHVQYLKNMNVGATLTISLLNEGKLWGIIACHHSQARHVPQEERFSCELIGRIFSSLIEVKIEEEARAQKHKLKVIHDQLCEQMKQEQDMTAGLTNHSPNLLDLTYAEGAAAALYLEGQWSLIGNTPSHEQIEHLTTWLLNHMGNDQIFHTHSLPSLFPAAIEYKDRACGLMAISIPKSERNFVLWFRPEVIEVVTWAGDPKKNVEHLPDGSFKIEPRHSFEGWKETQRLRSQPWVKSEIYAACELRSSIIELDLHRQFHKVQRSAIHLKRAKDAAEAANSAKSSFLANMSHEIRTPLGAIMGFVNLLKDSTIPREDTDEYLSIVERNSNQLLRIIDDILDLSKVEAGLLEIESINTSLIQILKDFNAQSTVKAKEKGIVFRLVPMSSLPDIIKSDPTRIRQILANVVGNAMKFTTEGSVELRVGFVNGLLEFEVKDTGPGISKDQEERLFKPFSQADVSTTRQFGGSGLGLVLTRRLSEALGGEFVLQESEVGVGSTFVVRFPITVPPTTRLVTPQGINDFKEDSNKSILEGMRVLLVEDARDNQTLISIILKRVGAQMEIASDGGQGLKMAQTGQYDVILMDVQMPVMDGISVTKALRAKGITLPIIALTAHASKEERTRCLSAGFTDFLTKPLQRDQLIKVVGSFHPDKT